MQAADVSVARSPARTAARGSRDALHEAARAQWVVTLGLVPGTLALFQQVSVVSALANAVAIPVVTLAVVPLILFAIAVPIDAPWQFAHGVLALLMRYLEWVAELPVATWASHAPSRWTVARRDRRRRCGCLRRAAFRDAASASRGCCRWRCCCRRAVPGGGARVTVLDVGQGLAVFVATATHALVYDTGPRFNDTVDAGGRIVVPFLRAAGVARLDALVVSHADTDHSGGRAVDASRGAGRSADFVAADRIIRSWRRPQAHGNRRALRGGHDVGVGSASHSRCCILAREHYGDATRKSNDLSCVLRIETAGGRVLLTGDIEARSEDDLLQRVPPVAASDVLVVPASRLAHVVHGSVHRRRVTARSPSSPPAIATASAIRAPTSSRGIG